VLFTVKLDRDASLFMTVPVKPMVTGLFEASATLQDSRHERLRARLLLGRRVQRGN
jgi:hypothetical protein